MMHRYLADPADPAFADLLRIYHAAFDRSTREPDEQLVAELRGEYRLPFRFLITEEGGHLLAFARFCRLPRTGNGFLVHIAVDEIARGGGIGTDLLRSVIASVAPAPLFVEIDRTGAVRDWYARNGFRPVAERYTQPALHPDTSPVAFALYASAPVGDRAATIRAFYEEVWQLDEAHPFVREAIGD